MLDDSANRAARRRRATELLARLVNQVSCCADKLSDPSNSSVPVSLPYADLDPLPFTQDDLDELAGYLRELGYEPLAGRLKKEGTEVVQAWMEAKGLHPSAVPDPVLRVEFARGDARRFIQLLEETRNELSREMNSPGSVCSPLSWLQHAFGSPPPSAILPGQVDTHGAAAGQGREMVVPTGAVPADGPKIKISEVAGKICRSKDAVEKALRAEGAPKPCVVGRPGQANFYWWSEMRAFCLRTWKIDIGEPPKKPPT